MADFDWTSLIGPALGIGASLYGGNQNAKAASNALVPMQQATQQATAYQQPYLDVGSRAAALLNNEDITQLPGYQTGLDAGLDAINRRAAATGGFNTGNRQKALVKYGTDYNAAKTAERQNQLMRLLGVGQQAAGNVGSLATNYGNSAAMSSVVGNNSRNSGITSALDLASKYLTSKDSSGQTGAQNLWSGASSALSNLLGNDSSQRNVAAFDDSMAGDWWS